MQYSKKKSRFIDTRLFYSMSLPGVVVCTGASWTSVDFCEFEASQGFIISKEEEKNKNKRKKEKFSFM